MKRKDLYSSCSTPEEHASVLYRKLSELSHDQSPMEGLSVSMDERLKKLLLEAFQQAEDETVNALCFVIDGLASKLAGKAWPEVAAFKKVLDRMKEVGFVVAETEHGPAREALPPKSDLEVRLLARMEALEKDAKHYWAVGQHMRESRLGRVEALEDFAARVARMAKAELGLHDAMPAIPVERRAACESVAAWEPKKP